MKTTGTSPCAAIHRCAAKVAFAIAVALWPAPIPAQADADAPVGRWTTIDDTTHAARAEVEIRESGGVLSGRIVRLFRDSGEEPAPRCEKCPGERHGQPVIGMTMLWNLRRHGSDWSGGEILDPETGRIYRASVHAIDHGRHLEVRGYIGISLLGRTQIWERAPDGG